MKIVWGRSIGWNMSFNGFGKFKPTGWTPMQMKTQILTDGADCYPWRQVFAFWPVRTVGGKWVWLRRIYKRRFWVVWGTGFHMEPEVQYGTLFDIIDYGDEF
jgi:hypothetical protein